MDSFIDGWNLFIDGLLSDDGWNLFIDGLLSDDGWPSMALCRYNNPWEYGYVEHPEIIINSHKFDISLPFLIFFVSYKNMSIF
jgi:hypothetical protein